MADPARRRATFDDLRDVPAHLVGEILNGDLVTSPRPAPPHAQAASSLSGELYAPFHRGRGGPGGWIILNEPELHLHGDVLVPDIGGWRRERMPGLPSGSAFELAPDWVCEVLSPSTASTDRAVKVPIYATEKVGHVWLVDPLLQGCALAWRNSGVQQEREQTQIPGVHDVLKWKEDSELPNVCAPQIFWRRRASSHD